MKDVTPPGSETSSNSFYVEETAGALNLPRGLRSKPSRPESEE